MQKIVLKVNDSDITIISKPKTIVYSEGVLECSFSFNSSWDAYQNKNAMFWNDKGECYPEEIVEGVCSVPKEALTGQTFKIGVSADTEGLVMPTTLVKIQLRESAYTDSTSSVTPSLYQRLVTYINDKVETFLSSSSIATALGYTPANKSTVDTHTTEISQLNENNTKIESSIGGKYFNATVIDNTYVGATGFVASDSFTSTSLIKIPYNTTHIDVVCNLFGASGLAFFDNDNNVIFFITGANASTYGYDNSDLKQKITIQVPNNAKYFAASLYETQYSNPSDFKLLFSQLNPMSFTVSDIKEDTDLLIDTIGDSEYASDFSDTYYGGFVSSDGIHPSSNFTRTGSIYVSPIANYVSVKCHLYGASGIAFYGENGNVLSYVIGNNADIYGYSNTDAEQNVKLTIPNGTYTMMASRYDASGKKATASDFDVMFYISNSIQNNLKELSNNVRECNTSSYWYKEKKIVTFGDSIVEQNTWQPSIGSYFGCNMVNRGIGGSTVFNNGSTDTNGNPLWMCSDYRIGLIDTDADVIIIEAGNNDWAQSCPVGDLGDGNLIDTTFYSAYSLMIKKIVNTHPNAKIYCLTCIGGRTELQSNGDKLASVNGKTLRDFSDCIIKCCQYFGIPCIDVNAESGISCFNRDKYIIDNVHPNALGGKLFANAVINGLKRFEPIDL